MRTIFTPQVLRKLADDWATGKYTKADLSRKYNTSKATITRSIQKLEVLGLA